LQEVVKRFGWNVIVPDFESQIDGHVTVGGSKLSWTDCRVKGMRLRTDDPISFDESIAQLKKLKGIEIVGDKITGDLKFLQNLTDLEFLVLHAPVVSGNLSSLENLTELKVLDLSRSDAITGDLASLQDVRRLHSLHLPDLQVTGHLKDLASSWSLWSLNLRNTRLMGDLAYLRFAKAMHKIDLSHTNVLGDIDVMLEWRNIKHVDFSHTRVSGEMTGRELLPWEQLHKPVQLLDSEPIPRTIPWHTPKLKTLNLGHTQVTFLPKAWAKYGNSFVDGIMPQLTQLDLSGISLNTSVSKLLFFLQDCRELSSLKAADCDLTGKIPSFLDAQAHGKLRFRLKFLGESLVTLDLSGNYLSEVMDLPSACQSVILSRNKGSIGFAKDVFQQAIAAGVYLDLQSSVFENQLEAVNMIEEGVINMTISRTTINQDQGFACYDVDHSLLQVSPDMFAPQKLCSCVPGRKGSGVQCQKCPKNFFSEDYSGKCTPCPDGSTSPEGSSSPNHCRCKGGELFKQQEWTCGCPAMHALFDNHCVKCSDLHLNCSSPGTNALSALPQPGFTRLGNSIRAFQCLKPSARCNAIEHGPKDGCEDGYSGPLCSECSPKYYAIGSACKPCTVAARRSFAVRVLCFLMLVLALGTVFWRLWRSSHPVSLPQAALKELLKRQAPILLQMCQLWAILAYLSTNSSSLAMAARVGDHHLASANFWEVPYVHGALLSLQDLKNAFNLQCIYDGSKLRFTFSLIAPIFPLFVLLCCCVLELKRRGLGIRVALQVITYLYIGGASDSAALLTCQKTDAGGDRLPDNFTFRQVMPSIFCNEKSMWNSFVYVVGYFTAFCYGVVIPSCLFYVFSRQYLVLQNSQMTGSAAAHLLGDLRICLYEIRGKSTEKVSRKDENFTRRLVATAAAYISVLVRGPVRVRIEDGIAIVNFDQGEGEPLERGECPPNDLAAWTLETRLHERAVTLRCRTIARMLQERSILDVVAPNDRVLLGSQHLLSKYMLSQNLWMEIVKKLAAVSLVRLVVSVKGLEFSLGITLTMAATTAMMQPYSQKQVNVLQSCSFLCLALAAWSFASQGVWLSRMALALPFCVSLVQCLQPDGPENLAERLRQDLQAQLPALQRGETVEVNAEICNFI